MPQKLRGGGWEVVGFGVWGCWPKGNQALKLQLGICCTQRTQYPLIKEYTLNHIRDPIII